jgi:Uma2 family endonuclease
MPTTSSITTTQRGIAAKIYRLSVDEYERMVEAGVLDDPRVELIDGLLVRKTEKKPPRVIATERLSRLLERTVPEGWHVGKGGPVRIPAFNEPEPDLAIIAGPAADYREEYPGPGEVALLVEVAETSLVHDTGDKLAAYATGGIPVYWVVNLIDSRVEVYTQPGPDGYVSRQEFAPGQHIPVIVAGVDRGRIAVSEMLS